MSAAKYSTNKLLMGAGGLFILACILVFVAGLFAPRALAFLDGIMCPDGTQLSHRSAQQLDSDGDTLDATTLVCEGDGRSVDATGRVLALEFGLAIIAAAFMATAVGGPKGVS